VLSVCCQSLKWSKVLLPQLISHSGAHDALKGVGVVGEELGSQADLTDEALSGGKTLKHSNGQLIVGGI